MKINPGQVFYAIRRKKKKPKQKHVDNYINN